MYIELKPVSYIDRGKHLTAADRKDIARTWDGSWKAQVQIKTSDFLIDRLLEDLVVLGFPYKHQVKDDVTDWLNSINARFTHNTFLQEIARRWRSQIILNPEDLVLTRAQEFLSNYFAHADRQNRRSLDIALNRFVRETSQFYLTLHKAVIQAKAWLEFYSDHGTHDCLQLELLRNLRAVDAAWQNTHRVGQVQKLTAPQAHALSS